MNACLLSIHFEVVLNLLMTYHVCVPCFLFSTANCSRKLQPLFGLMELGTVFIQKTKKTRLEAAVGGHKVVYAQHYTLTVKALEERVTLAGRPNLLTYLLGTQFVSSMSRSRSRSRV